MDSDLNAEQERLEQLMRETKEIINRTCDRHLDLQETIRSLQREVAVWKQAFERADEENSRKKQFNGELDAAAEQRLTGKAEGATMTLCIIDGDTNVFAQDLVVQGAVGGRRAAQLLAGSLNSGEPANVPGAARGHQTWVTLFFDRAALVNALVSTRACSEEQFNGFMQGFSQALDLFSVIDVGPGKDAADQKVKAYLRTFSRVTQVHRVVFCGAHDRHYKMSFQALRNEGLISKVALMNGTAGALPELSPYRLPHVDVPGLFAVPGSVLPLDDRDSPQPSPQTPPAPSDPPPGPTSPSSTGNGAFSFTKHNKGTSFGSFQIKSPKYLDPSIPISKHTPPPCNFFYLATCNKPMGKCQYSHDYVLTPDQLTDMRAMAKRSPCMSMNRNLVCPMGEACCLGHVCPQGPNCSFLRAGKCKFTGNNMHV